MMEKEEFYNLFSNQVIVDESNLKKLADLTDEFPYFQVAWLLYLKNLKKRNNPDFQNLLAKGALRVPDRKQLFNILNKSVAFRQKNLSGKTNTGSLEYNLNDAEDAEYGDSLIDKFLSSEPAPIRIKNDELGDVVDSTDNEPTDVSVNEDDEMITETLAMIYFEQKKYDKALDAFKRLSLKYPEKSIYFATRIAEIEKLKNI